ncbi:MAG: SPOR domain-containing protein, partial [Paracoccaceae bacterium]
LSVTALRREEVPVVPDVIEPATVSPPDADLIQQQPLNSVAEIAANAIEAATADAAAAPVSALERPFIQIGIFSIQANADNTADMMRAAGVIPTITKSQSSGKTFWRVIVGPAADAAERSALLETVRGLGFSDAYAVTN